VICRNITLVELPYFLSAELFSGRISRRDERGIDPLDGSMFEGSTDQSGRTIFSNVLRVEKFSVTSQFNPSTRLLEVEVRDNGSPDLRLLLATKWHQGSGKFGEVTNTLCFLSSALLPNFRLLVSASPGHERYLDEKDSVEAVFGEVFRRVGEEAITYGSSKIVVPLRGLGSSLVCLLTMHSYTVYLDDSDIINGQEGVAIFELGSRALEDSPTLAALGDRAT
jgi:hypothetical protein